MPRRARSSCSSPPARTPSGSRRSCGPSGSRRYRAAGRNYFGQQQVVDLLAYLRLLHNRYDDEALLTVLASPFVGVSNDALVLIRADGASVSRSSGRSSGRSPPISPTRIDGCSCAFRQRYERLVEAAAAVPLELLCERIVVEHDYDLAVLARRDGQRRYANLRKLARLARSYEELRGADLEGFIRFVAEQEAVGARESDAVSEEEGADAVRLLTIHAAKGLEFKVVVVADAGRERPHADEILCLSDGRFGFKVAHPATGTRVGTESYHDVKETRDRAERCRAAAPLLRRDDARDGAADRLRLRRPTGRARRARPRSAGCSPGSARRRGAERRPGRPGRDRARGGRRRPADRPRAPRASCRDGRGGARPGPADESGQLALFEGAGETLPAPAPRLRELAVIPVPPLHRVSRLSYSAISLFERCSYRYYAERVAGMQPVPWGPVDGGSGGLHPTEIGDAVHRRSSRSTSRRRRRPRTSATSSGGWYPAVSELELDRVESLVSAYCASPLASRIAELGGARVERPFAFELDGVLLNGRLDVLWRDGSSALVLDYKTNVLDGRLPREVVESEYRAQRLVYALACLRAGVDEVEIVYQFLDAPEDVVSASFGRDDVDASSGSWLPRSRGSAKATSGRRRARSPAPAVLRSTSCAPGRRC